MKKVRSVFIILALLALALIVFILGSLPSKTPPVTYRTSPTNTPTQPTPTPTNAVQKGTAKEGLDLGFMALTVKKAKDAADLEKLLNQPYRVNNLDLNEDRKVDYLQVTESENATSELKGFSVMVDLGNNHIYEIASIILEKKTVDDKQEVIVHTTGNQEIYRSENYFISQWNFDDSPFVSWAYSDHQFYSSPSHDGSFPQGYIAFAPVDKKSYLNNKKKEFPYWFIDALRSAALLKSHPLKNRPSLPSRNQEEVANNQAPSPRPLDQTRNPSRAATRTSNYPKAKVHRVGLRTSRSIRAVVHSRIRRNLHHRVRSHHQYQRTRPRFPKSRAHH